MIGVTEALLLGIGQGFVSTFSQAHPFLHTYVVLPVSFVTFSLSLFILAKTFLITPTFVSLMPSFNRQKVSNTKDIIINQLASCFDGQFLTFYNRFYFPIMCILSRCLLLWIFLPACFV